MRFTSVAKYAVGVSILSGSVLGMSAVSSVGADTAYVALRTLCLSQGKDAQNRILEVKGVAGKPQPTVWQIVLEERGGRGGSELFEVQQGRVGQKRATAPRKEGGARLNLNVVQLDSDGAFQVANEEATRAGVAFDRLTYTLASSNQAGLPTWTVELFEGAATRVGFLKIAADNALVLERSPELAMTDDQKRESRWSKPGEPLKSVPDAFHRFGRFSRSTGVKLKNWASGYGWTDERDAAPPER